MNQVKTVGKLLKEAREAQFYKLEDVERHTKIRKELIQALEEDNYAKLPPTTFIQGFIKNYSKFLELDSDKMLAIFRRDYEARKHPPRVLESFKSPLEKPSWRISPQQVITGIIAVLVLTFFGYLWIQYHQYVGSPILEVTSPIEQQSVEIPQVTVEGDTDREAKVTVNNQQITVDNTGHFKEEVKLSSSNNSVEITATSKFGKSTTIKRTVFVKK